VLARYHDATSPGKRDFELLPAIDLRGGRVVRLLRGSFSAETAYADDPVAVARSFVAEGARWLHLVDLDGARTGRPRQSDVIRAITAGLGQPVRCQVAGGLRDEASVAAALGSGAARAVVGTAALADPAFVAAIVEAHGAARIVVALDVRDGRAVGDGWVGERSGGRVEDALAAFLDAGVLTFAVTAIERDGTLEGPDLGLLRRLVRTGRARIIASGGISSLDDIQAVRDAGCAGVIVGRALYEGRLALAEAVSAAR